MGGSDGHSTQHICHLLVGLIGCWRLISRINKPKYMPVFVGCELRLCIAWAGPLNGIADFYFIFAGPGLFYLAR